MKRKVHSLAVNQSTGHQPVLAPAHMLSGQGACQPPKNMTVASEETVIMLTYSANMNIAKLSDEYSVWKPATSSPSASGRSNGARLVSPTMDTRYVVNDGSSRKMYQTRFWADTICDVDIVPAKRNTVANERPIATS